MFCDVFADGMRAKINIAIAIVNRQNRIQLAARNAVSMPVYLDDPMKPVEIIDSDDNVDCDSNDGNSRDSGNCDNNDSDGYTKINTGFEFEDFEVGELVESYFEGAWYQAYIVKSDAGRQSFTLQWPDHSFSNDVPSTFIRRH